MKKIDSKNAPEPVGLYPHARRVGNLLFLSGIGPRKPNTSPFLTSKEISSTANFCPKLFERFSTDIILILTIKFKDSII